VPFGFCPVQSPRLVSFQEMNLFAARVGERGNRIWAGYLLDSFFLAETEIFFGLTSAVLGRLTSRTPSS